MKNVDEKNFKQNNKSEIKDFQKSINKNRSNYEQTKEKKVNYNGQNKNNQYKKNDSRKKFENNKKNGVKPDNFVNRKNLNNNVSGDNYKKINDNNLENTEYKKTNGNNLDNSKFKKFNGNNSDNSNMKKMNGSNSDNFNMKKMNGSNSDNSNMNKMNGNNSENTKLKKFNGNNLDNPKIKKTNGNNSENTKYKKMNDNNSGNVKINNTKNKKINYNNSNGRYNNQKTEKNLNYNHSHNKKNQNNDKVKNNSSIENSNNNFEKKEDNIVKEENHNIESNGSSEIVKEKNKTTKLLLITTLIITFIIMVLIVIFTCNFLGARIQKNVSIDNIDVSKLTVSEAKNKIENQYNDILGDKILVYTYKGVDYELNLDEIEFSYLIDKSVSEAYKVSRNPNIFSAIKDYYSLKFGKKLNIELKYYYNKEKLSQKIKEIEADFYKDVKQYSFVIDKDKIRITNGIAGEQVIYDEFEKEFNDSISDKNLERKIKIPVYIENPEPIDVVKIHNDVYVEMKNAYYTINPFEIHEEVRGVNFDISKLKDMINLEPNKEEYIIDLVYTEPQIRVGDLDLYNDVLGSFSTAYVNNPNRTTNLRLAASKIDGMILMPGESFSYNDVVGERTVAAGYKNAAIYINGEVEDGLAGGICQISSTLYDAVVFANLEVTERYNHARVPSYVTAGRDATVYWGSKDFKFKNNRNYPIKISVSVNGGYATVKINGKKTENEFDISFESSVVGRGNGYMKVNTYKVYKQNGVVINREYLYTDLYKV